MKAIGKRVAALALCAAFLIPGSSALPAPSWVGDTIRHSITQLGDGLNYSSNTTNHQNAGRVEERILIRDAGSPAVPVVISGDYIYNSNLTLKQASDKLAGYGYTVVGGYTGDMFSTSTGVSLGLTIRDGIIRSCDNDLWAAGFRADGGAIVGEPGLNITLTGGAAGEAVIGIDRINRVRDSGKIYLYTPHFSTDTRTTKAGRHVVLSVDGSLRIGGTVSGTVLAVRDGSAAEPLRQGEIVLSASSQAEIDRLGALTEGMSYTLSITGNSGWENVQFSCGGLHALVKNGSVVTGLGTDRAPRTAVGMKEDGSLVLFAVDGRQSGYSSGMSLTDVAYRMQSLGCVNALELDGGGSTAAGITFPGKTDFTVVNSPSDGSLRKCANYIFLVNPTAKTGVASRGFVYGTERELLVGAGAQMEFAASDANWHAVSPPSASWSVSDSGVGHISSSGMFTATSAGETTVYGTGGGATGGKAVKVIDTADSVTIKNETTGGAVTALQAAPGTVVSLTAVARRNTFNVVSYDTCFTWEATGGAGTVDQNGTFTFGDKVGTKGELVVTGAGHTVRIPVSVGVAPALVENFEEDPVPIESQGTGMSYSADISIKTAGRGLRSGLFGYQFTPGEGSTPEAGISANIPISGSPAFLNLLVKGDGSGHALDVLFANSAGAVTRVEATRLDNGEYRSLQIPVPSGSVRIAGFALRPTGAKTSGSFHMDHLVAAWNERTSDSAPAIAISSPDPDAQPGNLVFTASVTDSNGLIIPRELVEVSWDGSEEEFTYDEATGQLRVVVPDPVSDLHILSVTATDVFGNRRKAQAQVKRDRADNLDRFIDVKGGWMEMYADFLDGRGLLPSREENGLRYFDPQKELTRLEMVEMVVALMGVDVSRYSGQTLPFTDAAQIPSGSLPAVKAAYALGVVAGIAHSDGTVSLGWNQPIMRQDFCVIVLGAVPKGYDRKALSFSDAGDVAAYAREAVETFVSVGAISGMGDGTFRPRKTITRAEASAVLTNLFF